MKIKNTILLCFFYLHMLWGQAFDGLTLFSPIGNSQGQGGPYYSYLIDNDLNLIHSWEHQRGAASMPYLLQDSKRIDSLLLDLMGSFLLILDNSLVPFPLPNSQKADQI